MYWGVTKSPVGTAIVAFNKNNVTALYFSSDIDAFLRDFPSLGTLDRSDTMAASIVKRAFDGDQLIKPHFDGASDFQIAVWNELLRIKRGSTYTYTDIAAAIGRPSAVRAVASAIGSNPVSLIVPCHRVLRRDGSLGGYRWGLPVKIALLELEGASLPRSALHHPL